MMNLRLLFQTTTAALILLAGTQAAFAEKTEKKYIYEGDESARSLCMSIAKNQLNRFNRVLRYKRAGLTDTTVHKRFTCNGKDLLSFAEEMNAKDIAHYLAPKYNKQSSTEIVSIEKSRPSND